MADVSNQEMGLQDVVSPPPVHEISSNEALRRSFLASIEQFLTLRNPTPERLHHFIKEEVALLKRTSRRLPDEKLEPMLDWSFNIFRLEPNILSGKGELTPYEKEASARTQHCMAHAIIFANSGPEGFVQAQYRILRNTARQISRVENPAANLELRKIWSGLRCETAVIRALLSEKYRVFLPDYAQDPTSIPESQNEVLQLDILSGIDLLTVSPDGRIVLIDVKGKPAELVPEARLWGLKRIPIGEIKNPAVGDAVLNICTRTSLDIPEFYYYTVLAFPSEPQSFISSNIGFTDYTDTYTQRQALSQFGRFDYLMERDIINLVAGITQKQPIRRAA